MFANTNAGGMTIAGPNVNLTPPLAIPVPYGSLGTWANAIPATCALTVLIENKFVCNLGTVIAVTATDAPGAIAGVVSGTVSGTAMSSVGSAVVFVEGLPLTRQLDAVGSNNVSNCVGLTAAPCQALVLAMR